MIRIAKIEDLTEINDIYNLAIDSRSATADLEHITIESRRNWFYKHNSEKYPVFVYEKDNRIAGWLSVSPYRENRKALDSVVEVSYYLHPDFQRQGIGSELLNFILDNAQQYDIKKLICILLEINFASIRLLEKFGFEQWGYMPDIVNLDGKICSHLYYGLSLSKY
jgi:phosphinothricin acetyltransferase